MTQIRVHKRPRPRRRERAELSEPKPSGRDRRAERRVSNAKIYEWLDLPTWRD